MAENNDKNDGSGLAFLLIIIGFAIIVFFAGFDNLTLLIFVLFGSIAMIAGFGMTAEMRSFLGIPFIIMFLLIFTSQYPAIMGQAIFGYWWPQVENVFDQFSGPLNAALGQASQGLSDAWLMLTCPQCYYQEIAIRNTVTNTRLMEGGTSKSIEFVQFNLMPTFPGILEPTEPVVVNFEVQNQGEFDAGGMNLTLSSIWRNNDPDNIYETIDEPLGSVIYLECLGANTWREGNIAFCNWTTPTYYDERKYASYVLEDDAQSIGSNWGVLSSECQWRNIDNNNELEDCTCFSTCPNENFVYKHSGETVKVFANLSFNYNVNVTIPFEIISNNAYMESARAGNPIVMTNVTSSYTGGPVKATIFVPYQPARTGQNHLVVASVYNDGQGVLSRVNDFTVIIYGDYIESVIKIASTFKTSRVNDGCSQVQKSGNDFVITCRNTYGSLDKGGYKRLSLYVKPVSDDSLITDVKSTLMIGKVNYDYTNYKIETLTMANAPPQ